MNHSSEPGGMTELFRRLAALEPAAFNEIVVRVAEPLRAFARRRLRRVPELSATYDEDDAFQSALSVFWLQILGGGMEPPGGMDDFLRLARTIIDRRVRDRARAERAAKRNPTPNQDPRCSTGPIDRYIDDGADVLGAGIPLSEAQLIAEDETRWLLRLLGWRLGEVASDRFVDGLTVEEIAAKRQMSERTVARHFQEIREIWREAVRKYRD